MARLFSSGFELGTTTDRVEFKNESASLTLSTTTVRSGTYAARCSSLSSGSRNGAVFSRSTVAASGPYYWRFYLYIATGPSATNAIFSINGTVDTLSSPIASICLNSDLSLRLTDEDGTIGSDSSPLSLNIWYRIEMGYNGTPSSGSHVLNARIDGTEFAASTTRSLSSGICSWGVGGNLKSEAQTTGDWFFDDCAMNDSTGAAQNSYPGDGSIIHMHPSADGDNNDALSGTWADVSEVTPDDVTTIAVIDDNTDLFDVNCQTSASAGIGSSDTIILVQVGIREASATNAQSSWNLRLKSASGGTVSSGSSSINGASAYHTNGSLQVNSYTLTSYTDPTTGIAWTPTGTNSLDNMQIGIDPSDANPDINLSTLWGLVEYIPAAVSAAITGTITPTATEANVVAGGKTIIITLTSDTWVASGGTFDGIRQDIIDDIDSAQSEANGWDAVVKATQGVSGVVRTSDTVVTITLDAFATYNITADETITVTVPASAVVGGNAIVATPTFQVTAAANTARLLTLLGVGS